MSTNATPTAPWSSAQRLSRLYALLEREGVTLWTSPDDPWNPVAWDKTPSLGLQGLIKELGSDLRWMLSNGKIPGHGSLRGQAPPRPQTPAHVAPTPVPETPADRWKPRLPKAHIAARDLANHDATLDSILRFLASSYGDLPEQVREKVAAAELDAVAQRLARAQAPTPVQATFFAHPATNPTIAADADLEEVLPHLENYERLQGRSVPDFQPEPEPATIQAAAEVAQTTYIPALTAADGELHEAFEDFDKVPNGLFTGFLATHKLSSAETVLLLYVHHRQFGYASSTGKNDGSEGALILLKACAEQVSMARITVQRALEALVRKGLLRREYVNHGQGGMRCWLLIPR